MMNASTIYTKLVNMGVSKAYASQIANGKRKPSLAMAIRVFRKIGLKIGPLEGASKRDIEAAERISA